MKMIAMAAKDILTFKHIRDRYTLSELLSKLKMISYTTQIGGWGGGGDYMLGSGLKICIDDCNLIYTR